MVENSVIERVSKTAGTEEGKHRQGFRGMALFSDIVVMNM